MKRRKLILLMMALLGIGLAVGWMVRVNVREQRDLALLEAVKSNDTWKVKALLETGGDANARQVDSQSSSAAQKWKAFWNRLLHRASSEEDAPGYRLSALEILLAERVRSDGETSLPPENVEMVRLLLDHGADPNVQSVPDITPLTRALCLKQEHVVRLLLARGAKPFPLTVDGDPLLIYCSPEAVALLIRYGAPFDTPDEKERTPLMYVCGRPKHADWIESGEPVTLSIRPRALDPSVEPDVRSPDQLNLNVLRPLIAAGARVNAKDKEGWTALMAAASNGDLAKMRLLVDAGADVNARDLQGKTAIDHAGDNWEGDPPKGGYKSHFNVKAGEIISFPVRVSGHVYLTTAEYRATRDILRKASQRPKQGATQVDPK